MWALWREAAVVTEKGKRERSTRDAQEKHFPKTIGSVKERG